VGGVEVDRIELAGPFGVPRRADDREPDDLPGPLGDQDGAREVLAPQRALPVGGPVLGAEAVEVVVG
jgi:hypothetical protein